jgi:mono/diheme cytochrome c family protein
MTRLLLLALLAAVPLAAEDVAWNAAHAVLAEHCLDCHGTKKQKGGLRLDTPAAVLHGGKHGSVLPTASNQGELLERVRMKADEDEAMPPDGARLTKSEIETLNTWLRAQTAKKP